MKILVLDTGGTAIKSAIFDDANVLSDIRITPSNARDLDARTETITDLIKEYSVFDVLSVATTGQVNDREKTILFRYHTPPTANRAAYPIGDILQKAVGRPVFLLNDCNAAALGEAYFGAGRNYENFLCLTYGTGVGGAIIQNRSLYTGSCGIAGEVGHMVTHKGGRLCGCRRRGCYEQYASTTALLRNARTIHPEFENAKQIFEAANDDPRLRRVIRAWEKEIVAGLLTLTYIFNPTCIILGGGVMEQKDLSEEIRREFYKQVIPTFAGVDLLCAELGNRAGMFGAAVYARQQLELSKTE